MSKMWIAKLTNNAVFALRLCVVVALAATCASISFAQTPARRQTPAPGVTTPSTSQSEERTAERADNSSQTGVPAAQADLSITARVTARELRFEKVPNPTVEFTGQPRRVTVWQAERENLPDEVQPGMTYRNVGITLRITSVFADIDRIVAEALGEIPASDDAPPPSTTLERPVTRPATAQAAVPTAQRTRPVSKGRSN